MGGGREGGLLAVAIGALLGACGGSGGGGGGPGPGFTTPIIDVAVRGTGGSGARIHIYRDVLQGAVSGEAPDVRVAPPANIVFMGFTGAELVLAADFGVANQNRIWVYTQADLAADPATPSVQCLLPPPAGATGVVIRDLVVHRGDVYVHSVYDDGAFPITLKWITHVFRDVTTLTGGSSPDATITHETHTTSAFLTAHDSLAVDDDVLLATGHNRITLNLTPGSLAGAEVPDSTLDMATDLGLSAPVKAVLGDGVAYLHRPQGVSAFPDARNLSAGQTALFTLQGPSNASPLQGAILRLGDRLFLRGPVGASPISIVGFDVAGPVADFAPPDVMLGPPVVGDQRLDGAADTLFAATVASGFVAGYARASLLVDGDEPSLYLYDPEIVSAAELRAVQR